MRALRILAFVIFGFTCGCSKVDSLTPLDEVVLSSTAPNSVKVSFCTDASYDQKLVLKTVIILDHSGSNQENYRMAQDGSGAPMLPPEVSAAYGTDPKGTLRYGAVGTPGTLLNYLSSLPANDPQDPARFFALVNFSDAASTYPANASGFTSDLSGFFNFVQQDAQAGGSGPADGGATSYLSALNAAYKIINTDIQSAAACEVLPSGSVSPGAWCPKPGEQVASSYVIVFMSDGSPIIGLSGIGRDAQGNIIQTGKITVTKEATTDILGKVGAIVALQENARYVTSVNMFTIYYFQPGNVDTGGQTLLANMARAGNGVSYNAISGSNLNWNQFQPPRKRIKYQLADIFVTNATAVWWDDGELHADRDMDGLPDDIEPKFNFNPAWHSTANDGIGDLVRYRLMNNVDLNQCSGVKSSVVAGLKTYQASDPNGLNDCEKILLNDIGGINNPDSNSDLIPDWLEFKNGVPFALGSAPAINVPDQDGFSVYSKIKRSLPVSLSSNQILNYVPSDYALSLISSSAEKDCYRLVVHNLPIVASDDVIRVDIIEKAELLKTNYLYRVGKKQMDAGTVEFLNWNDPSEIILQTWSLWP